jgi:hypothetical protein
LYLLNKAFLIFLFWKKSKKNRTDRPENSAFRKFLNKEIVQIRKVEEKMFQFNCLKSSFAFFIENKIELNANAICNSALSHWVVLIDFLALNEQSDLKFSDWAMLDA